MINMVHPAVVQLLLILIKIVCLLVAIAYYTIAERKIMAAVQRRRGPNVVGFWGLLQPLADGLKLIAKEMVIPSHANSRIFVIAPLCILTLGLLNWSILPFGCFDRSEYASEIEVLNYLRDINCTPEVAVEGRASSFSFMLEMNDISDVRYGLLVVLALSSLTVYGLIIAGWASNSKYAFLGALRSAAQMISYEVSISLVLIPVIFMSGSLNFTEIVCAQGSTVMYVFPLLPLSIIFFISMIAETNRTPFDLPEAEAELVAGYNVEYSSIIFAMFFLAEYGNMIMMSLIKAELFLGGWIGPSFLPASTTLALKALIFCFAFVLVRATFPRYRYDQLMDIGWKIFLPVSTGLLLLVIGVILAFDAAPVVSEIAGLFSTIRPNTGRRLGTPVLRASMLRHRYSLRPLREFTNSSFTARGTHVLILCLFLTAALAVMVLVILHKLDERLAAMTLAHAQELAARDLAAAENLRMVTEHYQIIIDKLTSAISAKPSKLFTWAQDTALGIGSMLLMKLIFGY